MHPFHMNLISKFNYSLKAEDGVTSIEYALIAGLIAVVIVLAVTNLGAAVQGMYQLIADSFPN